MSVESIFDDDPERRQLVVWHARGSTVYDTTSFSVDDKSSVLVVYEPGDRANPRTLAAFNAQFWIHADLVQTQHLDLVRSGRFPDGGESGAEEVRAEA